MTLVPRTLLSKPAVDLLFRVMEAGGKQIGGATLTNYFPRAAKTLLASGLLVPRDHVPVVAGTARFIVHPFVRFRAAG